MTRLPAPLAIGAGLLAGSLLAGIAWASPLAIIDGKKGKFDVTVTKATTTSERDAITITYRPDSTKVNCAPIYLVQTCRDRDQNGNVIQPKAYKSGAFTHLQDDMAWAGTYVDHSVCERDHFYNGEDKGKDVTSAGSSDGHTATGTTMYDAPHTRSGSFPDGVTTITSTFEVCAVCKPGGEILDCVTWTWTRSKTDAGQGTIAGPTVADSASLEFKVALAKYDINHKNGTVCPEEVAESSPGGRNVGTGPSKKSPVDPPVQGQASTVSWDVVNTGPQDVTNVTWTVMLDGMPLTWGLVPFIGWFDFATVEFPLPALPAGPHVLTMLVDSDYLIPEYDEADNFAMDEFEVRPAVGVGPVRPAVKLGITGLLPNPTRGRVAATVSLPDAGRATLELVDLGGRRVREFAVAGPGVHTMHLELGRDVGPGLYLLRLRQGGQEAVRKLTIVR